MKLHEEKLKKIIKAVEEYASVRKVELINTAVYIGTPGTCKVLEIDLNKPLMFRIDFVLGEAKEDIGINREE